MVSGPTEFVYDMGYTQLEFAKVLNGGFTAETSPYRCQPLSPDSWLVTDHQGSLKVSIQLKPLPPRVLGSIALPVLKVKFFLTEDTQNQSAQFFEKFFKYFHKGGG